MSCCNECVECREPKKPCGCGEPQRVLSIEVDPTNPARLAFNLDGKTVWYDFTSLVKFAETKTSIAMDEADRVMRYNGESGESTISAKELGSILHIADIGDVDGDGVDEGSFLIYKKDANCADGCEGINNRWIAWNEGDNRATSLNSVLGFDGDGRPFALQPPTHTNQYYQLGWNAENKLSYSQPIQVTSTTGTVPVRMDTTTHQLVYVSSEES